MKIFRENSPLELALQEVEAVMRKHGLSISWEYGFVVRKGDVEGTIKELESRDVPTCLPRQIESERIVPDEG